MKRRPVLLFAAVSAWLCLAGCGHGGAGGATRENYGMKVTETPSFTDGVATEKLDSHYLTGELEAYVNAVASGDSAAVGNLRSHSGTSGMRIADEIKAAAGHGKPVTLDYSVFFRRMGGPDSSHTYEITGTIGFADGASQCFAASLTTDAGLTPDETVVSDNQHPAVAKFDIGSAAELQRYGDNTL